MATNHPLKGAHLVANEKVVKFIGLAIADLEAHGFSDSMIDAGEGLKIIQSLEVSGWTRVDDKFGRKVYVSIPFPCGSGTDGELRVTLVLAKNDMLMLDIRYWGGY